MDKEKKIAELKNLAREISEKVQALNSEASVNKDAYTTLEQLSQLLYKNIVSLTIIDELQESFTHIAKTEVKTEEVFINQLEMEFLSETSAPIQPVSEIKIQESDEQPPHKQTTAVLLNIGVNDKFRFIKELFEGNAQEYSIAVNQLNNIINKQEAQLYIDSLKKIYRWQDDNECFISFIEITNKRFL